MPRYLSELGVTVETDVQKTITWCEVANVLRIQLERQKIQYFPSLREYNLYYGIDEALIEKCNPEVLLMHPGPINRGVELNSDAADGRNSLILDQVENGVAVRMAILYLLAGNARN
jgi:aspartate carbamoyltransferase catalytic subunit